MPTIIPIPMPMHHGHSSPMTEHDSKVLIGCLIILSVLWIISSVFLIIKYRKLKNKSLHDGFWDYYYIGDYLLLGFLNAVMSIIYGAGILIWSGSLVAKLL